jgi:hypothetical protein
MLTAQQPTDAERRAVLACLSRAKSLHRTGQHVAANEASKCAAAVAMQLGLDIVAIREEARA